MQLSLRTLWAVALALLLVACASHPTRVGCDGQLKPINVPAPAKPVSAHP
jgi:hypothetical protein